MTRRDYVLIASALKSARDYQSSSTHAWAFAYGCDTTALELAKSLGRANARFDRGRFLRDSGVTQSVGSVLDSIDSPQP